MGKPGEGWTTLAELKPGSLFEGVNGRKAVRSSSTSDRGDYITTVTLDDGQMARDRANLIVRPLPSPLTEEDRQRARYELAAILHQMRTPAAVREAGTYSDPDEWTAVDLPAPGQIMTLPPATVADFSAVTSEALMAEMQAPFYQPLSRLLWLLSLPRELLGFVCAAAQDPTDEVTVGVFHDWLLDQQRDSEAELFVQGWKDRLVGLIQNYGMHREDAGTEGGLGWDGNAERKLADQVFEQIRKLLNVPSA